MKRNSYWKDGLYVDTTTGREYEPREFCEICNKAPASEFHHYLKQAKCKRDLNSRKVKEPRQWTQDFINENQQLWAVCRKHHEDIHNPYNELYSKYNYKGE